MTVSRVVRGTLNVRPATMERVRKAVAELGYKPDPVLSSLAAYRTKTLAGKGSALAFLDCDGTEYSAEVCRGAVVEAALLGYKVEPFRLPPGNGQERLARMLWHRGTRGLLFGPSEELMEFTGWNWDEFAAVSLGALSHRPKLHAVAPDYFEAAAGGCVLLEQRGCKRIALVVERHLQSRTGRRWLGGYRSRLAGRRGLVFDGNPDEAARLRRWLKEERVDGVLTIHSQACTVAGKLRLPVLGLNGGVKGDGVPYWALAPEGIGAEGVRILHHLLLRQEYGLPALPKMVALRGEYAGGSV